MRLILAALAAFFVLTIPTSAAPSPSFSLTATVVDGFPAFPGDDWVQYDISYKGGIGNLDLLIHHRCFDAANNEIYGGSATGTSYGIGDERIWWSGNSKTGFRALAVYAPGTTAFPARCEGWVYAGPSPTPATPLSAVAVTFP